MADSRIAEDVPVELLQFQPSLQDDTVDFNVHKWAKSAKYKSTSTHDFLHVEYYSYTL